MNGQPRTIPNEIRRDAGFDRRDAGATHLKTQPAQREFLPGSKRFLFSKTVESLCSAAKVVAHDAICA
jgi:hypothetical protein